MRSEKINYSTQIARLGLRRVWNWVHVAGNSRRRCQHDCSELWADDYFVGCGWELELYAAGLVCVDCVGQVQG